MTISKKLYDYVLLFNMLNMDRFKMYANLIREYGEQSEWCDQMKEDIFYFAKEYELDYNEFKEAVSPSFDFYIEYFLEHPDIKDTEKSENPEID